MSEKSKRRWFQIHLSTAIILMFTAACLMGLNFIPDIGFALASYRPPLPIEEWQCYGFPFWMRIEVTYWESAWNVLGKGTQWDAAGLIADSIFAVVILFATAWLAERRIRSPKAV